MLRLFPLLALALILGGIAAAPPADRADAASNILWRDCFDVYECGKLQVPLDHRKPREAMIEIALIRLPAIDQENKVGSLLVNFGGPGGPGVEGVLQSALFFPDRLVDNFDIVGFDPRGVGQSTAIDCVDDFRDFPTFDSTPSSRSYEEQISFWKEFGRDCQRRSRELIQHVNTNAAARDMDLIREALGDEKLTYVGFSYGTLLGAAYAELFPEKVRALVLDGALDPANDGEDLLVEGAVGTDVALKGFFDLCLASPGCPFKAPDLAAAFDQIVNRAEAEPLPGWEFPITSDDILNATFNSLYTSDAFLTLAEAMRQAYEDGSGVGFGVLISGIQSDDDDEMVDFTNGFEAFSAIACVDIAQLDGEAAFQRALAAVVEASPRFGAAQAFGIGLPCAFWPPAERREVRPYAAAGASPILVISTRFDPATPYVWGVDLAAQLESGVLVSYEGYGHTASGECITNIQESYLVDLVVPPSGTSCASEEDPFPEPELTEPTPVPPPPTPSRPSGIITPPDTGTGGDNAASDGVIAVAFGMVLGAIGLTAIALRAA